MMTFKGSMFILEDDDIILDRLENDLFAELPEDQRAKARIDGFEITSATNAQEAWERLEKAHREGVFFDVAIFDLGVPADDGGKTGSNSPEVGLRVLEKLKALERKSSVPLCGAIVVSSAHLDNPAVLETLLETLLRLGTVFDYRPKPWGDKDILDSVVHAYLQAQHRKSHGRIPGELHQGADPRARRRPLLYVGQLDYQHHEAAHQGRHRHSKQDRHPGQHPRGRTQNAQPL